MNLYLFFALLGGLLVLAFAANSLVRFTGVPDIIILMFIGVLIGPTFHWLNPEVFRGASRGFGSLALMLILFEGGLDLKLRELVRYVGGGFFLSIVSYALSSSAVAAVCHLMLRFDWISSLLVGAVLGCLSSSIILPVLQQVNLRRKVKVTLLVESSLGDAFAVLAVTSLLNLAGGGSASPRAILGGLLFSLLIATAAGILVGVLWSYLLPVLSEVRLWHVLTFAAVLLLYSGTHALRGNELVAVLVFGLTLSNFPAVRRRLHLESTATDWFSEIPIKAEHGGAPDLHRKQMLMFHGELAFLLRTFFFVLLGALVEFAGLRANVVLALACFGPLLFARWFAVQFGSIAWRDFTSHERELMVWFLPRGLITAVLGIEVVEARGAAFAFLPSLAFAIILLSNLALLIGTLRARHFAASTPPETLAEGAADADAL